MNEPPLVSVLTPTYNHELYIRQCIQSVLAQTDGRWEQIVLDDGSTDATGTIVSQFRDERVRYVRQEHRGIEHLGETYNKGLAMARGELIAILEGDDFWPADKLERQIPAFADPGLVLSWGQGIQVDAAGAVLRVWPRPPLPGSPEAGGPDRGVVVRRLLAYNFLPACTVMCRRDALTTIGGFWQPPGVPVVDYPTWLLLTRLGHIVPAKGILGYWRRHPSQVTKVMEREMLAIPRFKWASWTVAGLSPAEQAELGLTSREAAELDAARRAGIARTDFAAGRAALREHRRDDARAFFRDAMQTSAGRARAKAFVALTLTRLGVNLDSLLRARDILTRS